MGWQSCQTPRILWFLKMESTDRQSITRNLVQLVQQTDIDSLLPKLLEKGVFSEGMLEKYAPDRSTPLMRKEELFLDIQTRGPLAFEKLVHSLIETGHFDLARVLNPDVNIQTYLSSRARLAEDSVPDWGASSRHRGVVPMTLPQYLLNDNRGLPARLHNLALDNADATINLSTQPLKVVVKQATHRYDRCTKKGLPVYAMGSRPKGYFFMINNVQFINDIEEVRNGAEIDEVNLKILFRDLGYEVISFRDQGLNDMRRKIEEFAQSERHLHVDSCVVAVLSHGRAGPENTNIIAADGGQLSIEWVVDCFSNRYCPHLQGKPKIFIFQTCRGVLSDFGVKVVAGRTREDGVANIMLRSYSDILIAYSTVPGYKSCRDTYLGTWFIQTICKIFMEHACDTDIGDMLVMVDNSLSSLVSEVNTMQTSCTENRGFHKFYFNPGIYDDDTSTIAEPQG